MKHAFTGNNIHMRVEEARENFHDQERHQRCALSVPLNVTRYGAGRTKSAPRRSNHPRKGSAVGLVSLQPAEGLVLGVFDCGRIKETSIVRTAVYMVMRQTKQVQTLGLVGPCARRRRRWARPWTASTMMRSSPCFIFYQSKTFSLCGR